MIIQIHNLVAHIDNFDVKYIKFYNVQFCKTNGPAANIRGSKIETRKKFSQ
jgi:hypothetical protein